jgi:hypothetical protein
VVIYTAVVGAVGFYLGTQYQIRQEASTKAAVQSALKGCGARAGRGISVKKLATVPTPAPIQPVATSTPQPTQPLSCREAIRRTWPGNLQDLAILTMSRENGAENPVRISAFNSDGSRDFGCFQINNFAHAGFFASSDWSDPLQSATYAYQHIFAGRGNWSAWYARMQPKPRPEVLRNMVQLKEQTRQTGSSHGRACDL